MKTRKGDYWGRYKIQFIRGYAVLTIAGRGISVHRLVWEQAHGELPENLEIHHKDNDRLNNALENLQAVTRAEHRAIHGRRYKNADGVEMKQCRSCDRHLTLSDFAVIGKKHVQAYCNNCLKQQEASRRRRTKKARQPDNSRQRGLFGRQSQ